MTSTTTISNSEHDDFPHLEPLAVENGDKHGVRSADFNVHDLASAVKHDHNYSSVNCSVGTQTLLNSKDLDEQDQEIKRLKAKLEDKKIFGERYYQSSNHGRLFGEILHWNTLPSVTYGYF